LHQRSHNTQNKTIHQQATTSTKYIMPCRQCGQKDHFTLNCLLRTPADRPKPWKETVDAFAAAEQLKPFKCEIPMHPGKQATVRSDTVATFWTGIHEAQQYSLYRDFAGIIDAETKSYLILSDALIVQPGNYILGSRTYPLSDKQLYSSINDGVARLKEMRPLAKKAVARVQ
jgi:hypothetical protein